MKCWYDRDCDWAQACGQPWGDRRQGMTHNGIHYDRMEWLPEVHGNRYGHDVGMVHGIKAGWLLAREWVRLWLIGDDHYRGLVWVRWSMWRKGLVSSPFPFGKSRNGGRK